MTTENLVVGVGLPFLAATALIGGGVVGGWLAPSMRKRLESAMSCALLLMFVTGAVASLALAMMSRSLLPVLPGAVFLLAGGNALRQFRRTGWWSERTVQARGAA